MEDIIYELVIDKEEDEVFAISLVKSPAIERDWVAFSSEQENFAIVNKDQKMLIGAIMVPDKKIPRVDDFNKTYYVFFSKETIKQIAYKFMQKSYQNEATLEHNVDIEGVTLVESWIVENPLKDKSNNYNLTLPSGTWTGMFKINNDEIWEEYIKTGKVKGFSVEGMFEHVPTKMSSVMEKDIDELNEEELEQVIKNLIDIINDKQV